MALHLDPAEAGSDDYLAPRRVAWSVFALTLALMLFDFVDRQIVVSMFPFLKSQWSLSDSQLGTLVSVVSIAVGVFALPVALLADRWSRVKMIAAMAILWSLATIACGFARSYEELLVARVLIGVGEAGYGAVGGALLATLFPSRHRAVILAAFGAAAAVGGVLGVVLGGVISALWGWQAAFGIVGAPGLLLALMYLLVRDYATQALPEAGGTAGRAGALTGAVLAELFRARSAIAAYAGGALQLFVVSTIYTWLPSFLNREYGLPPEQAAMRAAAVLLAGSAGAVVWGHLADRFGARRPQRKMQVIAWASLASFVALSLGFGALPPGPAQFVLIVIGAVCMTGTIGTVSAVAVDVVHPSVRATAVGMVAFVQNIFGLAAGPLIAGRMSDAFGLAAAMAIVPVFALASGVVLTLGARSYESDLRDARARLPASGAAGRRVPA